ncbi:hypothetical protein N7537_001381 [Penicillium hordei]|uniref:Uncharacterized protein n=1 Tax=Penicillium hordei TaxID=40994 RepID=A0AAD6EFD0_9EURO|nr:uncharacterized protein N7537_001381 [Penicillium hordei]KAJ5616267.1 hypothetical protein N7537_001381 [Penicillium hordei]
MVGYPVARSSAADLTSLTANPTPIAGIAIVMSLWPSPALPARTLSAHILLSDCDPNGTLMVTYTAQ